jgi:class 3 adenylate cyclase
LRPEIAALVRKEIALRGREIKLAHSGDTLDYFGATVNIAARLEHQCRGGEVIVSEAVAKDVETGAALADRMQFEETATLRGVSAPVQFVRVKGLRSARLPVV